MSAEREELARDLKKAESISTSFQHNLDYHRDTANYLTALGYRKPRTITTAEEREALPSLSVVRSSAGSIANIVSGEAYFFGYENSVPVTVLALPLTVLYTPEFGA